MPLKIHQYDIQGEIQNTDTDLHELRRWVSFSNMEKSKLGTIRPPTIPKDVIAMIFTLIYCLSKSVCILKITNCYPSLSWMHQYHTHSWSLHFCYSLESTLSDTKCGVLRFTSWRGRSVRSKQPHITVFSCFTDIIPASHWRVFCFGTVSLRFSGKVRWTC